MKSLIEAGYDKHMLGERRVCTLRCVGAKYPRNRRRVQTLRYGGVEESYQWNTTGAGMIRTLPGPLFLLRVTAMTTP